MAIRQLSLTDFRNLASTTIDFDSRINLIEGSNGSGKTSLLEALYVLCQGQSFRSTQLKHCIRHGRDGFLLFGRFDRFKAGLSRTVNKLEIRINGAVASRRSDLVRLAPVNIVNSDSFQLIDGSPARRRAYLDWSLFHVEPGYAEQWRLFQHALKQRNRLLKSGRDLNLLDYWDQHLVAPSLWLERKRREACETLRAIIDTEMTSMLGDIPLELGYRHGWRGDSDLATSLAGDRDRDIRAGYTHSGIHRDDVYLTSAGLGLDTVLSRGQGKRVCMALILSVLRLVDSRGDNPVILLIDDLYSELDEAARDQVYQHLEKLPIQLFITNIGDAAGAARQTKDCQRFHVEHGTIKPRIFD